MTPGCAHPWAVPATVGFVGIWSSREVTQNEVGEDILSASRNLSWRRQEAIQRSLDPYSYIESFNGKLRDECLSANWFLSLDDARAKIEDWRRDYNYERPHSALSNLTPAAFAAKRWG
jgi:transposase InsO family protein